MKKLEIIKVEDESLYTLKDKSNNEYEFSLTFYDIDFKPAVGDFIGMNVELLDELYDGYSTWYTFGSMDSEFGNPNIEKDNPDCIVLITKDKNIFLKRLYG